MKRFILAFLLALLPALALAQTGQTVRQSGTVTAGHAARWCGTGIVCDSGTPTNGSLSGLGITASGPSLCINSARNTASGWQALCLGATTAASAVLSLDAFGTAAAQSLNLRVNGLDLFLPATAGASGSCLVTNGAGITSWSADCGTGPGGSTTQVQFNNASNFGGSANLTWVSPLLTIGVNAVTTGQLGLANGGASGQTVTIQNPSTTSAFNFNLPISAGTANTPLLSGGGGSTAMAWGSRSGSTTVFGTTSGSLTASDCVQFDGNGNLVSAGGPCTTGGGGGTVSAGTAGQMAYYATSSTTISGNVNANITNGAFTLGQAASVIGQLKLAGNTSGTVTVSPQAAAGTYNFNLPTGAGTSGQPLLSGGGGGAAMTFGTLAVAGGGTGLTSGTSGGIPYFSGTTTLASSAALAVNGIVLGGGAGATPATLAVPASGTLLTGVAASAPAFSATPTLGVAGATTGKLLLAGSTSGTVTVTPANAAGTWTLTLPTDDGTTGQVLQSDGAGVTSWATLSGTGTVTSVVCGNTTITITGTCITDPGIGFQNCSLAAAVGSSALTISLKNAAGSDASSTSPCALFFRSATAATGTVSVSYVTAANNLVLTSGSTLGTASSSSCPGSTASCNPFRIWIVAFDDGGTIRLGAINTRSSTDIYPLGQVPLASSSSEGGAGGADTAQVFYTGTAISLKAYVVLGYFSFETGLAAAGTWSAVPTRIQMYGHGVPLPGTPVQQRVSASGVVNTGTLPITNDNSIPQQSTEGTLFMSKTITPTSAANVLVITHNGLYSSGTIIAFIAALFQDSAENALATISEFNPTSGGMLILAIDHMMVAGTAVATTFKIHMGASGAATLTFNGVAGAQRFGGTANSYLRIIEIMS